MENKFKISVKIKIISIILILLGLVSFIYGLLNYPERIWSNFLIDNYYFISITLGATFFMTLQYITQSGWSAMFKRVPEAISGYLPFAGILMLIFIVFGSHHLYNWLNEYIVQKDELIEHKSPYLNFTFLLIRFFIFFIVWILLTKILRKYSINEDAKGGAIYFNKSEFVSKVFIFCLALTFSLATFDWVMSINSHWFSTIFAIKNFVSAFYHGTAVIIIIVILLNKKGYFQKLNSDHLHDFSKYIFMLSIVWGYMWFSQFFLIWFSNIPEETNYFVYRTSPEWNLVFYLDILINWTFPFLFLMLNKIAKNTWALLFTSVIILLGMWIDIYLQIIPDVTKNNVFGFVEIGMFLGFLGIFILSVSISLSKANIIPVNHPYLEESLMHKLN